MSRDRKEYKAAAIIFYHREKGFFLGKEEGYKGWRHFGGKRKGYEDDPWRTACRELMEETDNQIIVAEQPADTCYYKPSKMVLFVKMCSDELVEELNKTRRTAIKLGFDWITLDELSDNSVTLPDYIKKQLLYIQERLAR